MKEITLDGINYVCEIVKSTEPTIWTHIQFYLEIGLVLLVVILTVLGVIIGINRIKEEYKSKNHNHKK